MSEQKTIPMEEIELEKNRPIWQTQIGGFRASIWENERQIKDRTVRVKELSFSKVFRNQQGEWKSTTRYQANEIPKAILALEKAYEYLALGTDTET
ncbi:MAG: hypothetical protein KC964_11325 [Candidatus Omnitrophica bacterium]|nr:hypothetical protein [Candidatus Omnitrophota bacterium]